jgi:hypothetical protein
MTEPLAVAVARLAKERDLNAWQKYVVVNGAAVAEFLREKRFNEPFETWTPDMIIDRMLPSHE